MVMQLTDQYGRQIKALTECSVDMELNDGDRDFEISVSALNYDKCMTYGCRVFVPGTEFGGVLGELNTSTAKDSVSWKGYTWRGMLHRKLIIPPSGQDYYTASGELNTILRSLIEPRFEGLFVVPDTDTNVAIGSWKFERFCTLLDGIVKMLKSVGYRLNIKYNQGEPNGVGWVEVQAVPIVDHSEELELSQDSGIDFRMSDKQNGVNHLVVGGKGELQDRNIIDLYVQADGTIGHEKYYTGVDEVEYFYENTSSDSEDVEEKGIEKLKTLMNSKTFEMDIESLGIDVAIGDIVGGRDYITGMEMKAPVGNIILKIKDGTVEKDYQLEEVK